nr:MAG TPA: hypothetical protein [Caudoviricetes sp.]
MYLFSDFPNHAAAHVVRPVRMPVQLRYGRPTPYWSFRPAGKAGHKPAAWPEDLGPYMPNPRKALTIRGCQVAPDVRQCVENLWRILLA